MLSKNKLLVSLVLLCLVDMVIPVPILGILLIYVVLEKPVWFMSLVRRTYNTPDIK